MCLSNFQGPKGTASSGQPCPAPGLPHPAHSPEPHVRALGPAAPAPVTPQQQGQSPAPHSPALPGPDLSPVSACPGTAPIPPAALLLAGAAGQSLDATPCLDMLKGAPVVPAPSLRLLSTPEVPCSILHGLGAILQHSTGKATWHVPSEI